MTGKADAALSRLAASAQALNQVSDRVSAYLTELEKTLNSFGLGVAAWIVLQTTEDQTSNGYRLTYRDEIGYGKFQGKWALLYDCYCEEMGEGNVRFLRDAPREYRIGALEKIPELLDKLAEEAQKLATDATAQLSHAEQLAATLRSAKKP